MASQRTCSLAAWWAGVLISGMGRLWALPNDLKHTEGKFSSIQQSHCAYMSLRCLDPEYCAELHLVLHQLT